MNLGFIGELLTGFTYIGAARETRAVLCMIPLGMVLGDIVNPIEVARGPIITKPAL